MTEDPLKKPNLSKVAASLIETMLEGDGKDMPALVGADAAAMSLYLRGLREATTAEQQQAIRLRIERLLENIEIYRRDDRREVVFDALLDILAILVRGVLVAIA